ncbi:MAG: Gfo/Idh/MocA family protein [Janthinobacterium lividum]
MTDVTRRTLVGSTAAGLAGLGLVGQAHAAEPVAQQPAALFGATKGDTVSLPPLHNDTEVQGQPPEGQPPAKRLGVAVVGLGHLSLEQIIPGFASSKNVRLAALVSGERDKARAIAAQHGVDEKNLYDYAGFDRLKDNPDVDIVYIVLPNAMHAEFTQRAAQAGKHVLCEKPMATSVADAQRMVDACRAANRKLMIAYRLQYNPVHRQLITMTRAQEFGPVRVIQAANGQNDAANGQWRQNRAMAGGGSLPDVGLYCLNAFRYLTGEEPIEVTGQLTQPKDDPRFREIEDVCAFTLRFPSGILASGLSDYSAHENRFLRVMGTEGWYGADPAFGYDNIVLQVGRRQGRSNLLEQRRFAPHNQFATEMDAFAEAIRADKEPHTPGEEGLQDMRVIEAIYQAAAGGSPVKLPLVAGLDTTRGPAPAEEG